MKKKEFLSTGEAARALGVSVKTIQRWDKAGLLPAIRTATNQRRILVDTVHHLLKGQEKALRWPPMPNFQCQTGTRSEFDPPGGTLATCSTRAKL